MGLNALAKNTENGEVDLGNLVNVGCDQVQRRVEAEMQDLFFGPFDIGDITDVACLFIPEESLERAQVRVAIKENYELQLTWGNF